MRTPRFEVGYKFIRRSIGKIETITDIIKHTNSKDIIIMITYETSHLCLNQTVINRNVIETMIALGQKVD